MPEQRLKRTRESYEKGSIHRDIQYLYMLMLVRASGVDLNDHTAITRYISDYFYNKGKELI